MNGVLEVNGNTQVAGKWDYIVKADGEILVGRKHSFMSQGGEVLAAGELKFSNGKLVDINIFLGIIFLIQEKLLIFFAYLKNRESI